MPGQQNRSRRTRRAGNGARVGILGVLIVTGWIVAGCDIFGQGCGSIVGHAACTFLPTGPPGGISKDDAIAAARRLAPAAGANLTVVWASVEPDPFTPPLTASPHVVWMVRLTGRFTASPCASGFLDRPASPADVACTDADGGLDVVLDYFSGALLGWTH